MKLAALCSGGKDSSYAIWLALKKNHEIDKIVTIFPKKKNSWMFHRPNKKILELYSQASRIPLIIGETIGEKEKELQDLKSTLQKLDIDGVVSGAVASNYQKSRIEKICSDLDLISLNPLWGMDPIDLLSEMQNEGFETIITSVSAEGLTKNWLGRKIDNECLDDLKKLNEKIGIHITGEGGEYETLVLDAPFFNKKITISESKKEWEGDRGALRIIKAKLEEK